MPGSIKQIFINLNCYEYVGRIKMSLTYIKGAIACCFSAVTSGAGQCEQVVRLSNSTGPGHESLRQWRKCCHLAAQFFMNITISNNDIDMNNP